MLAELRDVIGALGRDEVVPFFQPLVELRTGKLRGFEVLARWCHPQLGPILPSNFISVAEDNNLIGELTGQICRKAFQASELLTEELTLAVNVSPMQMRDRSLPTQIRQEAEQAGFSPSRLVIEITESALHHDLKQARLVAGDLKAMGCKLSLDDFGTGYSNLRHLQSLNFDELKIDRSFVSDITTVRDCRKIVAAIIGLGHSLDLQMIAEGVETEEQADMLIWLGCELAQGWRYGKAEPAREIPRMLAAEPVSALPALTSPGDDWATSSLEALPTLRLAQLQAIYDGAPVGLCFLDQKLRFISLNRRLAERNGSTVKSHIGRSLQEMYPQWFPLFEPFLLRALQGEAVLSVRLRRAAVGLGDDGKEVLASYQPAWDEADEVVGISISLLDVTERMLPDETALPSRDTRSIHFEVNPEVPWAMDSEGNDLQVSSRWVQTVPLGKDRTRNLHWLEALHIDDLEPTIKIMKHAMRTGVPIDVKYRILSVDGEWRWMRSRGSPQFGPSGEITRWYGSVEDIHDHLHDHELPERKSLRGRENETRKDNAVLAQGIAVAETLQTMIAESARSQEKE